jgi:hypothetical protein
MALRIPKDTSLFNLRPEWHRTRRFSPIGFKLVLKAQHRVKHWQGGPATHRGARCLQCKQSLLLIWNLALADQQFPPLFAAAFQPINRLPFYFCTNCGACSYRVIGEGQIQCFTPDADGESPFKEFPLELEQRRIAFLKIPSIVDGILTLEDLVGFDRLDQDAVRELNRYYGRRISSTWDMPFSQIGGQPLMTQGHRQIVCPNQRCPASKLEHPYGELQYDFLMKELAVIGRDCGSDFEKVYSQVAYHICCTCLTIHAQYRCS